MSTALVVLHPPSTHNLPIPTFQQLFYHLLFLFVEMSIPMFEEPDLTVKKRPMRFLWLTTNLFPISFTFRQHLQGGIKNLLNRAKIITLEVSIGILIGILRLQLVIGIKIIDPESIQMRMYGHMQDEGILLRLTVKIALGVETWEAGVGTNQWGQG